MKINAIVEYWKVPPDSSLSDLLDPEFIRKNGTLDKSYKVSRRDRFERLENTYMAKEDAMYPHIIYGYFNNLGQDRHEITAGTAGMFEDWDIVRDSYGLAV